MVKLSLSTISKEEISQTIKVNGEERLDVPFLLKLVEKIMYTAAGDEKVYKIYLQYKAYQHGEKESEAVDSSFKSPLCTLRKISFELVCYKFIN
ncbi:hypothetical protein FEM48_Zijuj07G0112300 [Ziziphus jujuba var. spinosa]|uniref:Uncharacterized protein n=1 Tax=Ziziphus jujuba var. spinosa TaxID=714518 RepID=A0A978V4A9_ZIZJJ|nr:hypothetical protein FEM48_Zijuj07G0112300 [Ziziphus jujuba var. spinosa]